MSQNLCKMTGIYVPELLQLDAYWKKAVEDAICDTLKGEKRLDYALRNRKKIKEELERLGCSRYKSPRGGRNSLYSLSGTSEECEEREVFLDGEGSRSKEKTPIEKRPKTPDRPLLGNGSLEKMKKSQNSFNCEPMGVDTQEDEMSWSEASELEADEAPVEASRGKSVEWLHVRKDRGFDCSDSESVNDLRGSLGIVENEFCKSATLKDKNYFISRKLSFRSPRKRRTTKDSPRETDKEDNALRLSTLNRRLQLALAKTEILKQNLKATRLGNAGTETTLGGAALKPADTKDALPPFVRFYLEVYRELCHKCSLKHIAEEAGRRWWGLTGRDRAAFDSATAT